MPMAYRPDGCVDVGPVIKGRPDFGDPRFGITQAKKFPPYVFSISKNSTLIHAVAYVELHWYRVVNNGHDLARMLRPVAIARCVCGQSKRLEADSSRSCLLPSPDAVRCGRCHGQPATWGKHGTNPMPKAAAAAKLGCLVKAY